MKFPKLLAVLFCMSIAFNVFAQERTLPDVTIQELSGKKVNIKDYADNGKITVLSFWATWCVPCKKELDNIAEYYADWQEDYNMELVAISVDNARSVTKIKSVVNSKGWEYTVLSDKNEDLKRALNFQAVPYTMVIDQEGNIVYRHDGYVEGDEFALEDVLKELTDDTAVEEAPKKKKKVKKSDKQ